MKLLLSYGADPSHKDVYGVSELGRLVPMRMMVYKVSDWEVDCARVLIEAGADVDAVWKPGQGPKCMSPLYFAIKFEETRMVRLLLEKGAKVANACMDGKKPSQWARKDTDPELMGMVIEAEKKEMLDSLLGFSRSFRLSGKHY